MRVSAEARKQRAARFQRFQQMKTRNGPARAVRFAGIVAGDDQCRTPVPLHHARGGDADHATMPAVAVHHQAVGLARAGFGQQLLDLLDDARLFLLALTVELVELLRQLARAGRVARAEQLDHVAATSMRPAALSRGPRRKAMSAEVSRRETSTVATSISAFSPAFTGERKPSSPSAAMTRFSPVSGTASATVAIATIFRNDFSSASICTARVSMASGEVSSACAS